MTKLAGKIIAISSSINKGERKQDQGQGLLVANYGLKGDAHASEKGHRQISLLAKESISKMQAQGLEVGPGDFAENLTTQGLELPTLPIGTRLRLGQEALGEVSQIGKECHAPCAIYHQAGDCVMPREGIFMRVLKGGKIINGDLIAVDNKIITVGIIIASDQGAAGQRADLSGPMAAETIKQIGGEVLEILILPDQREQLAAALRNFADSKRYDLILTSGGTGCAPRDITPEATLDVVERLVPGLAEAMRAASQEISPTAILSRAVAGIRGQSLIINLPGSPKAVRENLNAILTALPHAIATLRGQVHNCAEPL